MIVMLDSYGWIYDPDLARLADDGCPNLQPETGRVECQSCEGTHVRAHWFGDVLYSYCPDCGAEDIDYAEDAYGPMSVSWGFLL
jgi:rubredoxin